MLATVQLSWSLHASVTPSWRENRRSCLTLCGCGGIVLVRASVYIAGWSSLVARRAHNPKVVGSNPAPATIRILNPPPAGFLLAINATQASHYDRILNLPVRTASMHQNQSSASVATSVQDPCDDYRNRSYVYGLERQMLVSQPVHLLSVSLSAGAQDGLNLHARHLQYTSESLNAHDLYQRF